MKKIPLASGVLSAAALLTLIGSTTWAKDLALSLFSWRIDATLNQSAQSLNQPSPELTSSSPRVETFSSALQYSVPLPALPQRGDGPIQLALSYANGQDEGLGTGFSWGIPAIEINSSLGAGGLWSRKKNGPFVSAGIPGLEWNGRKLIYQGPMQAGASDSDLSLSNYHFTTQGPVQLYIPDGHDEFVRVWYLEQAFQFCIETCQSADDTVNVASGFVVRDAAGRMQVFSGDPMVAQGYFSPLSVSNSGKIEELPPYITRWPLVYDIELGGHTTQYRYAKDLEPTDGTGSSYLSEIILPGKKSRYLFETCKLGDENCAYITSNVDYSSGHARSGDRLYTQVRAEFAGQLQELWCLVYKGQSATQTSSGRLGSHTDCESLLGEVPADAAAYVKPVLDRILRMGEDPAQKAKPERLPDLVLSYLSPKVSGPFWSGYLKGGAAFTDWTRAQWVDANSDGLVDYLDETNRVRLGQNAGPMQLSEPSEILLTRDGQDLPASFQNGEMLWADMNGDGISDIVEWVSSGQTGFYYYAGRGGLNFEPAQLITNTEDLQVSVDELKKGIALFTDMNGDMAADFVRFRETELQILVNQIPLAGGMDPRFPAFSLPHSGNSLKNLITSGALALLDMNGDGLPDLVYTSPTDPGFCIYKNHGIHSVFRRTLSVGALNLFSPAHSSSLPCSAGDAAFASLPSYPKKWESSTPIWIDSDQDGFLDAVDQDAPGSLVSLWRYNGQTFQAPQRWNVEASITLDSRKSQVKVADPDGDGRQEIMVYLGLGRDQEILLIDFNKSPEGKDLIDSRELTQIETSTGLVHQIEYSGSHSEMEVQSDLPFPSPRPLVKRISSGLLSDGSIQAEKAEHKIFYYRHPVFSREYGTVLGFAETDVLDLGDLFAEHPSAPPALTQETYYGLTTDPLQGRELAQLAGMPLQSRSMRVDSNSLPVAALKQHIQSAMPSTHLAASALRQVPNGTMKRRTLDFGWALDWKSGEFKNGSKVETWRHSYLQRLTETIREHGSEADSIQTKSYQDYDEYNLPRCIQEEQESLTISLNNGMETIPERRELTCVDYLASRRALAGLGVLNQPSSTIAKDLLTQAEIQSTRYDYDSTWGKPRVVTEKVFTDIQSLSSKVREKLKDQVNTERKKVHTFDSFGHIISIHDDISLKSNPPLPVLKRSYDADGFFVLTEENAQAHRSAFCYGPVCAPGLEAPASLKPQDYGRLTFHKNPLGISESMSYDALGRLASITRSSGEIQLYRYRYGQAEGPSMTYTEIVSPSRSEAMLTSWDAVGNQLQQLQKQGSDAFVREWSELNGRGQLIKSAHPFKILDLKLADVFDKGELPKVDPKALHWDQFKYDEDDRSVEMIDAQGTISRTIFEPWGSLNELHFQDDQGTLRTDRSYRVEMNDRIYAVIDADGQTHRVTLDRFGNPQSLKVAGSDSEQTFAINSQGEVVASESPEHGQRVWVRDARGRIANIWLLNRDSGKSELISKTYDAIDQPLDVTINGVLDTRFMYDKGLLTEAFRADPLKLLNMKQTFTYDADGRLLKTTSTIGDRQFSDEFTYDAFGSHQEILSRDLNSGSNFKISYKRDAEGLLREIDLGLPWQSQPTALTRRMDYDEQGHLNRILYSNGVESRFEIDPAQLVLIRLTTALVSGNKNQVWQDQKLSYDGRKLLTAVEDLRPTANQDAAWNRTAHFAYTSRGELLTSERYNRLWEFSYRPHGDLNPLGTDATAYSYDGFGQPLRFPGVSRAVYDIYGNLIEMQKGNRTIQYGYSATGQRLYRRVIEGSKTTLTYYPSAYTEVHDGETEHFLVFGEQRVVQVATSAKRLWLNVHDASGNLESQIDEKGQLEAEFSLAPYGEILKARRGDGQNLSPTEIKARYLFQSHAFDEASGLHYKDGRFFDSGTGLYVNPSQERALSPEACVDGLDSCSIYGFPGGNPI